MPEPAPAPAQDPAPDLVDGLTRVLARTCRHLAAAGQPQLAGRLAADGWVLLRSTHPTQAQRLDGAMHHAALLETQRESSPPLHREDPS